MAPYAPRAPAAPYLNVMPHKLVRFIVPAGLILILATFAQAMLDLPYRPRLDSPVANYWAVAVLAALTPMLALEAARLIPKKWLRRTAFFGAALLVIPCLLISICAMLEAPRPSEPDMSYELLSEVRADRLAYRLYRTNCGATCAYGLELREELDLPFGVKLVSPKWSLYRASEGAVKLEQSEVLVMKADDVLGRVAR